MEKRVELRNTKDDRGTQYETATLGSNGDVRIEGQDPGKGVEVYFGEGLTEYQYVLTVKAADVPALLKALGAKSDVLSALQEQFWDQSQEGLQSFLENNDVPFEF
jgi:hypothetical protein